MFSLIYLALSRKYVWAVVAFIGLMIPLVNILLMILLFILWGLKGNQWIYGDDTLTATQQKNYIDFFDRIGIFAFALMVIVFVFWLLILVFGISTGMWRMKSGGMEALYELQWTEWLAEFEQMMQQLEAMEQVE